MPKPSSEHDYLDKEYKGRNGAIGSLSKPDGFEHSVLTGGESRQGARNSRVGHGTFPRIEPALETEIFDQ